MSFETLTVAQCMATAPLTITPETTLINAIRQMLEKSIIGSPVTDESGVLVGFISEQDGLRYLMGHKNDSTPAVKVGDVMMRDVLAASPDMMVTDIAELMSGNKPKQYPVCENSNKLVGVITREHVLKALLA